MPNGRLQHLIHHEHKTDTISEDPVLFQSNIYSIHDTIAIPEKREPNSYVHIQGKYCIDKVKTTFKIFRDAFYHFLPYTKKNPQPLKLRIHKFRVRNFSAEIDI